jgi:hypothetical protein
MGLERRMGALERELRRCTQVGVRAGGTILIASSMNMPAGTPTAARLCSNSISRARQTFS